MNLNFYKQLAKKIRCQILEIIYKSKSSHIGSCFSIVDILCVLYNQKINKFDDIFILSKGHATLALYVVLAEFRYFRKSLLNKYGLNNTKLMAHANHKVNGVELSTGSLGHGLSYGVGKCLAFKIKKNKKKVFVLMSDGELNEGSNWEALMFASHHNLNNLVAIIDYNKIQSLDFVSKTIKLEPLASKFKNFGLNVKIINGHNYKEIEKAINSLHQKKPTIIIANTVKGKGVKEMENKVLWHYKSPDENQFVKFKKELSR